jgi:hypothetical protein
MAKTDHLQENTGGKNGLQAVEIIFTSEQNGTRPNTVLLCATVLLCSFPSKDPKTAWVTHLVLRFLQKKSNQGSDDIY